MDASAVTVRDGNWVLEGDTVLSGLYCITGDVEIRAAVKGRATILATGCIRHLRTTDLEEGDLTLLPHATTEMAVALLGPTGPPVPATRWHGPAGTATIAGLVAWPWVATA